MFLKFKINLDKFLISSLLIYLVLVKRDLISNNLYAWVKKDSTKQSAENSSKEIKLHVL